jgi:hypothetical protein
MGVVSSSEFSCLLSLVSPTTDDVSKFCQSDSVSLASRVESKTVLQEVTARFVQSIPPFYGACRVLQEQVLVDDYYARTTEAGRNPTRTVDTTQTVIESC